MIAKLKGAVSLDQRPCAAACVAELTIDVVSSVDGIRALTPEYEHLYRVTGNTLPFSLQDWHLAWCTHFLNRTPQIEEQPLFCVARDPDGACVAIVPLIFTRRRLGPIRVATVSLIGADPGLSEIRSPLIAPGYERSCVRAVHQSLAKIRDWDWLQWSGVSGVLLEAIAQETSVEWHEVRDDYVLDLPSSWEELRAGLKRNIRESLRHCYNSLARDGYSFEFVVARAPREIHPALDRFLELHALRANMTIGTKHPDRFAGRSLRTFLYDVCDRLAARDVLRVFQLKIGPKIVASRIGFAVGDSVYLYYSGFDPAWRRYSVMTTTVAEALKYAVANGFKTVNLSPTGEQSKLRWRPRRVEFLSAIVHCESLSSRVKYRAYRAARLGAQGGVLKSIWAGRNWD